MDKGKHYIPILLFLALAGLFVLSSGCKKTGNPGGEGAVSEATDIDGHEVGELLISEPEVYAVALFIKCRAEYTVYLHENGDVFASAALNDEAVQIKDRVAIDNRRIEDGVNDIFRFAFEEYDVNPDKETVGVALLSTQVSESLSIELFNRACDVAEGFLKDKRNKTIWRNIPSNLVYAEEEPWQPGDEGQNNPSNWKSDHPCYNAEKDEFICASAKDIDSVIAAFKQNEGLPDIVEIRLSGDVTLDISNKDYQHIAFFCEGHAVKITGKYAYAEGDRRDGIVLDHPSSVDLSGLTIDENSAKLLPPDDAKEDGEDAEYFYWNPRRRCVDIARVDNAPGCKITYPADAYESNEDPGLGMFDVCLLKEDRNDGGVLRISAPGDSYEDRQEKETEVLQTLFEKGEYHSLTKQTSNNSFDICTDLTVDIGEVYLPNMDYDHISIGKGGHLKLTGTLHITGGTFVIDTKEYDGLDLTGLTIVKNHPSPDMIHIHYDPSVGINEAACHCKTASGKIYYSNGGDKVSITVW